MKHIIVALILLTGIVAQGAHWGISSEDPRNGGNIWAYGGALGGTTGGTNSAYAAVMPPGASKPVVMKLIACTDIVYSNANPARAWGSCLVQVPTNVAINVGAAVVGLTNYVITNPTEVTNAYGNTMASNTVLLTYNRASGKMTRVEPYQAWALGTANYMTNIVLRHPVTLLTGDKIFVMAIHSVFPIRDLAIYTNNAASYIMNLDGPIAVGEPGKPLLIEARSVGVESNAWVHAAGIFE